MKLTIILLTAAVLQVAAKGVAQTITFSGRDVSLEKVFKVIKKQTGYSVMYNADQLEKTRPVNVNASNTPLEVFLRQVLKEQPFDFSIENTTIFISQKVNPQPPVLPPARPAAPPADITGRVVNEAAQGLAGVSVKIKGTARTAITNANGEFQLADVPETVVLQFTHVGYERREVTLKDPKEPIAIVMKVSISDLDQVQIIAYGTTTKRLNPGDVTTITSKDIEKNPVNNVLEAIQGKVPGLFVQQVTGQPGGAFNLRMRGSANFASDAPQPLIVVDGVVYPGGKLPLSENTSYGTKDFLKGGSGLNYLNPNDIESISILKDADATALYGSSGAYGVLLITTKKAKAGAPTLNANIYTGVSVLGTTAKLMNTQQYLMLRREALANDGIAVSAFDKDINGAWPEDRYHDFREDLLGSAAQTTNLNVSYGGGTQNTNYMINGSLRNNGNIQRHKGSFRDGSLRFSLNTNTADNKLGLALSGTYLSSVSTMVPTDFSGSVALSAPNAPALFLPDGSINWELGANDLADDINKQYKNVTNNFLANGTLTYKPFKQLTLRAVFAYNNIKSMEFMGHPTTTRAPTYTNAALETHSLVHHYDIRTISVSPYADYNTTLGKRGDVSIKLGGRIDNKLSYTDEIHGVGFASDALLSNPAAGTTVTASYSETPYRSVGFHAVVKYVWDQKYVINLNGRRDGSTKFGSGRKFGNFGSVALAWLFSEEKWIKDHVPFVSFGKLRGSTGIIGGDAVPDFSYLSTYASIGGTYQGKVGLTTNSLANPLLSWEKNKNAELGIELGFFNDRIYLEANVYRNVASNQLITQSLSTVTGFGGYALNSDAIIRTSGWEFSLNTNNIKTTHFNWSTRFNLSIPRSKLVKLPTYRNLSSNYVIGKPVTGILLYKYTGINPATGYYSFTNAKGVTADYNSGLVDADRTEFLDLAPQYYGGFQNSVRYKQWSLDFSFTFTKRVGKNLLGQMGFPFGYMGINGGTEWLRRWQKPGDVTDMPRVSTRFTDWPRHDYLKTSTGAYSDASYARLQNVSINYRFNRSLLQKIHVKELSVYLQGQNLWTISNYGGLDPQNLDAATIPPMRVFTGGINITL
jgi:TonB-linked SusC/RagA family outer membrane protein